MGGMRLDDYGIARRQRRSGVAAGNREGEREVAGAEDDDRPERPQHRAHIGLRRHARGIGGVYAGHDPGALLCHSGEEAELVAGTGDLALEARQGQRGLEVGAFDQGLGRGVDAVGDAPQQRAALFTGACRQRRRSLDRGGNGLLDVLRARGEIDRIKRAAICWMKAAKGLSSLRREPSGNQRVALQGRDCGCCARHIRVPLDLGMNGEGKPSTDEL
jgi:hypothetical protein